MVWWGAGRGRAGEIVPGSFGLSEPLPAGLPVLSRGRHGGPEQGSCVMEYVSVLAGLRFTDRPRCTHPLLGWLARRVNDTVSDTARPRLALVAPDLIGTRVRHGAVRAVVYCELARTGRAAAPGERWLREFGELAEDHLSRHPTADDHSALDDSARATGPTAGRRWLQPLWSMDRNYLFGAVLTALASFDPADRDEQLIALLTESTTQTRLHLGIDPARSVSVVPVPHIH